MPDLHLPAVLAATVAAFLIGGLYYSLLGDALADVSSAGADAAAMTPAKVGVEVARCLVIAVVVAGLASRADVDGWAGGLALGAVLWVGFPLVLWVGAMVHESAPVTLAAIHAGDWLLKLAVVGVIVGAWQ